MPRCSPAKSRLPNRAKVVVALHARRGMAAALCQVVGTAALLYPYSLTHSGPNGVIVLGMSDSLDRLYQAVVAAQAADPVSSRTARLLRAGRSKMAKKLAEEAVEVAIDTMHGDRDAVVRESADLLYNLVVLWVASGVHPKDVWMEMERREQLLGIAEKLPKEGLDAPLREHPDAPPRQRPEAPARRKVIALDRSRVRKRR